MRIECGQFALHVREIFENAGFEVTESDLFSATPCFVCRTTQNPGQNLLVVFFGENHGLPDAFDARAILAKAAANGMDLVQFISLSPLTPSLSEFAAKTPNLSLVDRDAFFKALEALPGQATIEPDIDPAHDSAGPGVAPREDSSGHHNNPSSVDTIFCLPTLNCRFPVIIGSLVALIFVSIFSIIMSWSIGNQTYPKPPAPRNAYQNPALSMAPDAPLAGQAKALVIGNSTYRSGQIIAPKNDAPAIAEALIERGFEVTVQLDLNLKEIDRAVHTFIHSLAPTDLALFYFSGHGFEFGGRNYLLPIRRESGEETDPRLASYPVSRLMTGLDRIRCGRKIIVLDACRPNSITGGGLLPMAASKGTLIACAAQPGTTTPENEASHSPFSKHLANSFRREPDFGPLTLQECFENMAVDVERETGVRPWIHAHPELEEIMIWQSKTTNHPPSQKPLNR